MKKDNIYINIESINDINKYKELGYTNFLLSVKDYTIGYTGYSLEDISKIIANVYILINRLLDDNDIDVITKLNFPNNIKGFFIEDTGLLEILKNKGYKVYNYQNHLNNNYETIEYWNNYFDGVVLNNDITYEEIKEIANKSSKDVFINVYGYPMIMYSRRLLLTNYQENYNLPKCTELTASEHISKKSLRFSENENGTCVFDNRICDYRKCLDLDAKFIFNTKYLSFDEVKKALMGEHNENEAEMFLNTKTVYRVGDLK